MNLNFRFPASICRALKTSLNRQYLSCRFCVRNISCTNVNCSEPQTQEAEDPLNSNAAFRKKLLNGPNLKDFFKNEHLKGQDHLPDEEVCMINSNLWYEYVK